MPDSNKCRARGSAPIAAPFAAGQMADALPVGFDEHVIEAGGSLFGDGDKAGILYRVLEGALTGYKIFAEGHRQIVSFAFAGDIVGFCHGAAYRFHCDALLPSRVELIRESALILAAREDPDLYALLCEMTSRQLADVQAHSMLLARSTALQRFAGFLVQFIERAAPGQQAPVLLTLPMKRVDIADFLGLTIETVSRVIARLKQSGIIALKGPGAIAVLDIDRLRDVAGSRQTRSVGKAGTEPSD